MTPPNTYEEVPWMHKSISSFFLPSFYGPTQRGSLVSPYALTPHVSFQEKLHTKDILHYGEL
jgi:hypothetical protein